MIITEKQANFIEDICRVLSIPNPEISTKYEAQVWISKHIKEYRDEVEASDPFNMDMFGDLDPMEWMWGVKWQKKN